jgi:hypothetical protein
MIELTCQSTKYVASRTLRGPLEWNATLLEGDLAQSVTALKDKHDRTLVAVGAGELAHALTRLGLVDEFWVWVSPYLWPPGADFRRDRPGPPAADLLDDLPLWRGAASTRPARCCIRLTSGDVPQGGAWALAATAASASVKQHAVARACQQPTYAGRWWVLRRPARPPCPAVLAVQEIEQGGAIARFTHRRIARSAGNGWPRPGAEAGRWGD